MMWEEFEEIAGYEVSYETYTNVIEPMYMATNLSKQDFVKCLDKKAFALPTKKEMVKEMRKIATGMFEICGTTTLHDEMNALKELAEAYAKRFHGTSAWVDYHMAKGYCGGLTEYGYQFPIAISICHKGDLLESITLVKC